MSTATPQKNAQDGVDASQLDVATVLQALADPVRLDIVRQIAETGEVRCGQLDVPVGKSTCSHHLKSLSCAGVIAEREEGTRKYLSLRREELDRRFPGLLDSVLKATESR